MDDTEKAAVLGLLTKLAHLNRENYADESLRDEIDARIGARQADIENLGASLTIFGFENFVSLRKACGVEAYNKALIAAGYQRSELSYDPDGPSLKLGWGGGASDDLVPEKNNDKTVRDYVLDRLKVAGDNGAKASEIRAFIEKVRQTELHEKTVGMTLYRLSQDGLAVREGRTWFFVPEAKNPGGDTPGQDIFG